ncbi:hypothetical protein OPV22_012532 [Ensete ventricosum]|uniref:Secreted protein n=1 Tax=Ensete ventricosum TaxID=4639 RepID=A0AAV8R2U3_ENSVE|nr:hypothetical protein OPV22_012532 [Ensete ventricosum]
MISVSILACVTFRSVVLRACLGKQIRRLNSNTWHFAIILVSSCTGFDVQWNLNWEFSTLFETQFYLRPLRSRCQVP